MMTGQELEHWEKYDNLVATLGVESLIKKIDLLPNAEARIRKALAEGDEHLNTIPLREWDRIGGIIATGRDQENIRLIQDSTWQKMGKVQSAAQRVCCLKHVAKNYYLEEEE